MVQRLLNATLQENQSELELDEHILNKYKTFYELQIFLLVKIYIPRMLEFCNFQRQSAKEIEKKHRELHLANLLRNRKNDEPETGVVIGVKESYIEVILVNLDAEVKHRIHLQVT